MANIRSQSDRMPSNVYTLFTFKEVSGNREEVKDAQINLANAAAAFNAMRDSIIAQLNNAAVLRIKIQVETNEVIP